MIACKKVGGDEFSARPPAYFSPLGEQSQLHSEKQNPSVCRRFFLTFNFENPKEFNTVTLATPTEVEKKNSRHLYPFKECREPNRWYIAERKKQGRRPKWPTVLGLPQPLRK